MRGAPLFGILIYLTIGNNVNEVKKNLLNILICAVAVAVSYATQVNFDVHTRPIIDTNLNIFVNDVLARKSWSRTSSFLSDTATLFFGISAIIFSRNKILGIIALTWSFIVAGLFRVAFGLHYPSDIIGGFILGFACVYYFIRWSDTVSIIDVEVGQKYIRILQVFYYLLLMEAYSLFPGFQGLINSLGKLAKYLD